jgi:aarF domain-containing kinase
VCRNNGGIFIKAAQFASNLATVPVEYREELGAMMENECILPASVVRAMIEADTGRPLHETFLELSPDPVATASLAQVLLTHSAL